MITKFDESNGLPDNRVRSVYTDRDGTLWVGSYAGLSRWRQGNFEMVRGVSHDSRDIVFDVTEDNSGNLWVGSNVGLFRIRERPARAFTVDHGLALNDTRGLAKDADGNIWAAGFHGGLTRIAPDGSTAYFGQSHGLTSRALTSVGFDHEGILYVGTEFGIFRLEGSSFVEWKPAGIPDQVEVRRMRLFADGTFAILSRSGIVKVTDDSIDWLSFDDLGVPKEANDFLYDADGNLWIAARFSGVYVYDGREVVNIASQLTDREVRALLMDKRGRIWIGTGNGLNLFIPSSGPDQASKPLLSRLDPDNRVRRFGIQDGLRHNEFNAFLDTGGGFLWAPANFAVQRIHMNTLLNPEHLYPFPTIAFDYNDGLSGGRFTEVTPGSILQDHQGRIWAASQVGLAVIRQDIPGNISPLPPVQLAGLRVNGKPYPIQPNNVLPPETVNLTIQISVSNLDPSRQLVLQSRLLGISNEWVSSNGLDSFGNLRPGPYTYQVRVASNRDLDSAAVSQFKLHIQPHFYQTTAFKVLLPVLLSFVIAVLVWHLTRRNHIRQLELTRLVEQRTVEYSEATKLAEEANNAKTVFLANVGRDLLPPLGNIIELAEAMEASSPDAQQRAYLQEMARDGRSLLQMINGLLDMAKLESGAVELNPVAFTVDSLVNHMTSLIEPLASRKGLQFKVEIEEKAPLILFGDLTLTRQILANLLRNAVQFSDGGNITLTITSATAESTEMPMLLFSVYDGDTALNSQKRDDMFQAMDDNEHSWTGTFGAPELGISIARILTRKLGGRLWYESNKSGGSIFHVRIPYELPEGRQSNSLPSGNTPSTRSDSEWENLQVLVAEDNAMNQSVISMMLNHLHIQADVVGDGEEVLAALAKKAYDIILMDINMPKLNGLEAARQIRANYSRAHQPIIIPVTAYAFAEDMKNYAEHGMFRCIPKPIQLGNLSSVLEEAVQLRTIR
ncbi:MAG: response regulator [Verrucomicrobia bacterium]|nr:response regulator [Verrucomicrobiota bacterium]